MNGRPEKLEDVCYSRWVASSLTMIGLLYWIDGGKLTEFILNCQFVDVEVNNGHVLTRYRIKCTVALLTDLATWLIFFT